MPAAPDFAELLMLWLFTDDTVPTLPANFYVALHTDDPSAGDQTTDETTYTSYARQALIRATGAGGFAVTANQAANVDPVIFPASSGGGSQVITHFSLGELVTGAGAIFLYKELTTPQTINPSNIPSFNLLTATLKVLP